jgi:hypothetical protein
MRPQAGARAQGQAVGKLLCNVYDFLIDFNKMFSTIVLSDKIYRPFIVTVNSFLYFLL